MSKANGHIIAAFQLGYRVNLETGEVFNPQGEKLKPFRKSRKLPLLQFSVYLDARLTHLHREGPGNKARRCNIDLYRFIEYCKKGNAAFDSPVMVHCDGNLLNTSPDNIKACSYQEAGEIHSRNRNRKRSRYDGRN
jgi:hypothetical protein